MKIKFTFAFIPKNRKDYLNYINNTLAFSNSLDELFLAIDSFKKSNYFLTSLLKENLIIFALKEVSGSYTILNSQIYDPELSNDENLELFALREQNDELTQLTHE